MTGSTIGPLRVDGDTALQFRRDVLRPFFDQYLSDGAPKADTPPVFIYNTGENHWDRLQIVAAGMRPACAVKSKPLYLTANFGLSFAAPAERDPKSAVGYDEYVSDPAQAGALCSAARHRIRDGDTWRRWLLIDQRSVDGRSDVLDVRVAGADGGRFASAARLS